MGSGGGLGLEQLALAATLFDQALGRAAAARPLVEPVVVLDAPDDDVRLVQVGGATAACTLHASPVAQRHRFGGASGPVADGARGPRRPQLLGLLALDGARD